MGRKKGVVDFDESPLDDFDPIKEHLVRDKWIDIEKAKIIREKLRWCYPLKYLESTYSIGWGKDHCPYEFHGPKPEPVEICGFWKKCINLWGFGGRKNGR
ncbi:unnamed protein product [Malus baccata var. baccata]